MTQLNTPYPATAYLTGFLKQYDYAVTQLDLAIDVFLNMVSRTGLEAIMTNAENQGNGAQRSDDF